MMHPRPARCNAARPPFHGDSLRLQAWRRLAGLGGEHHDPPMHMPSGTTKQAIVERARELAPGFARRAEAAEEARRIPVESAKEMLEAGIARILMPPRFGGYGLDFETWCDAVLAISKAD